MAILVSPKSPIIWRAISAGAEVPGGLSFMRA